MKIFIADDDQIICRGLKAIIEKNASDCEVVGEANDGEDALSAIQTLKPDLLITDIKMPVMDGLELIRNIRDLGLRIKVIVLSGFDEYKYVRETLKTGAMDYLLKPVENRDLLELLNRVKSELSDEEKSMREYEEFNEIVTESVAMLQEKFLSDLLDGDCKGLHDYARRLNNSELLEPASFVLCVIAADKSYKLKKQEERDVFIGILGELYRSVSSAGYGEKFGQQVYRTIRGDRIYALFPAGKDCEEELSASLKQVMESLMEKLRESCNYTITVGISRLYDDIRHTSGAGREAQLALDSRFYKGGGRTIEYGQGSITYGKLQKDFGDNALDGLTGLIELGQITKTKRAMEEILQKLLQASISPEEYKEFLSNLVRRIFVVCPEFKYIADSYPERFDLLYIIDVTETAEELAGCITNTFCSIVEAMNLERSEKSKKVIEIVKEYIRKNFDKDISLKAVADHVHLNPTYLSEFFKREAGKNFMDFLTETRVKEAKKLLARPEIKIYEVGRMVGYEDTTTFNRAFKKITSVSPARYRDLLK